jgi:hypothetical protein
MRDVTEVLGGRRTPRQFTGPQPAKVVRVAGNDLFVELNTLRGAEFSARWSQPLAPHSHSDPDGQTGDYTPPTPPPGTACLVLFADAGVADAWVVAFDRWPA